MAHWNPYYNGSAQNNSLYDEQNIESQVFNPSVPYGGISYPYNDYYMNNYGSNLPTIRTAQEVEAEQYNRYYQNQVQPIPNQFTAPVEHFRGERNVNTPVYSNLTPTAAEFKPNTSNYPDTSVHTQVFSNNNFKSEASNFNKSDEKNKNDATLEPGTSAYRVNEETGAQSKAKSGNYMKFSNKKSYNRFDLPLNYNKSKDKYKQNFGRNRDDYVYNNESTKMSNGSARFSNYQRDNYYSRNNRYSKNGDNYGRNYQEQNERSSSDNSSYSSDKYRGSNSRNLYRSNYREENKYENWRSKSPVREQYNDNASKKIEKEEKHTFKSRNGREKNQKYGKNIENENDDVSQRDRLIEQVNKGTLECLVCCEFVRQIDKVWSCQKCYHIFHLRCSLKWAKTSKDDNGWRCPACQHVCAELPSTYTCYCGQVQDPGYRPGDNAHSCGSVCGRVGSKPGCLHRCRLLCHPGPCPTCEDLVSKSCNCGATKQIVKCSANIPLVCKAVCGKALNCDAHFCQKICHPKECDICTETIYQECFCGKANQTIPCTKDQVDVKNYCCNAVCDKLLKCGIHKCANVCHPGDCAPCDRAVEVVKTCPCGKTQLAEKRKSCLDPIPCCDKICGKIYICGQPVNPHMCQSVCHEGDCPPCPLTSHILCRCGHMSKEIPCAELMTRTDDARCQKKCTKKRSCAKHKCNQLCCIDVDHICPLPCNRSLTCGLHRCEQTCHKGRCQPCWRTSFDELYCECGSSVMYPPIMCGTRRPPCNKPCSREHSCDHEALHSCHSQPECPPCTVLTIKWCHGGHEKRTTIPCHQKNFSCGLPCNKELPCGRHKCILPCHLGPCLKEGQNCVQLCSVGRDTCGHPCGLPCHEPPCPESPCKELVKVTCECGLRTSSRACIDMTGEYQRIANSMLASKMADMQLGHSIDIGDVLGTTRKQILKTLECNDECRLIERNRRLAIGLQIKNPDLSAKLTPKYSDFMRQWAKKDPRFCQMVHDRLTELVQLAKQSKQKSRSYSFDSMNRDKRHFIHEYCEHFGCESAAYDQEPNRNVVATAGRDKAWLPSLSILQLLQRENGQRKVPGPILNRPLSTTKITSSQPVSLKVSTSSVPRASFSSTVQRPKTPEGESIDYFDYSPNK